MNAIKFLKSFKKSNPVKEAFTHEVKWVLKRYPNLQINYLSTEMVTFSGKKQKDDSNFSILISIVIIENEIQCTVSTRISRNNNDEETQMESARSVKKALLKLT